MVSALSICWLRDAPGSSRSCTAGDPSNQSMRVPGHESPLAPTMQGFSGEPDAPRSAPTGDMTATYPPALDPKQGSTGLQIDFEPGDRRRVLKMRLEPAPVAWFSGNWATSAGFGSILSALFDVASSKCVPSDLPGSACTKPGDYRVSGAWQRPDAKNARRG